MAMNSIAALTSQKAMQNIPKRDGHEDADARRFNNCDPLTWPMVLTPEQIALIYQRSVGAVKKACQQHRFLPAPYQIKPFRWRKVDVLRDVEGARGFQNGRRIGSPPLRS